MLREDSIRTGIQLATLLHSKGKSLQPNGFSMVDDIHKALGPLLQIVKHESYALRAAIDANDENEISRIVSLINKESDTKEMNIYNSHDVLLTETGNLLATRLSNNLEFGKKIIVPLILRMCDDLAPALDHTSMRASDFLQLELKEPIMVEGNSEDFPVHWNITDVTHIQEYLPNEVLESIGLKESLQDTGLSIFTVLDSLIGVYSAPNADVIFDYLVRLATEIINDPYLDNKRPSVENREFGQRLYEVAMHHACRVSEDIYTSNTILSILNPQFPDLVFRPDVLNKQVIYLNSERSSKLDVDSTSDPEFLPEVIIGYLLSDNKPFTLTPSNLNDPEKAGRYRVIARDYLHNYISDSVTKHRMLLALVKRSIDSIYSEYSDSIKIYNPDFNIEDDYSTGVSELSVYRSDFVVNEEAITKIATELVGRFMFRTFDMGDLLASLTTSDTTTTPNYLVVSHLVKTISQFLNMNVYLNHIGDRSIVVSGE